ncbi:DUF4352 domain-containing protein [Blastomonas sp. UPD001]|uniref:DUF4352 domain-containing protein n=1 Tax=Blastomonas sp. UPD001 TaxID=2217673 RepID=UPI0013001BE8|nr:DUF4352 domain-containing protein [Blastomonas sp. UPD001]
MNKAIFAAFALLALSACGSEPGESAEQEAAPAKVYAIGETVPIEGSELTITKVEEKTSLGGALGAKAEPGESFIVAYYSQKNTSKAPVELISSSDFSLIDSSGTRYIEDSMASIVAASAMENAAAFETTVNPGVSSRSAIVWKVAKANFNKATWTVKFNELTFSLK